MRSHTLPAQDAAAVATNRRKRYVFTYLHLYRPEVFFQTTRGFSFHDQPGETGGRDQKNQDLVACRCAGNLSQRPALDLT